jgi:hypothetical protein
VAAAVAGAAAAAWPLQIQRKLAYDYEDAKDL